MENLLRSISVPYINSFSKLSQKTVIVVQITIHHCNWDDFVQGKQKQSPQKLSMKFCLKCQVFDRKSDHIIFGFSLPFHLSK